MINVYDTNNWARIKFEVGLPLRDLYHTAFHSPLSLFVFDGFDAKAIRKAIYEGYKEKRIKAPDNFYIMLGVFKELLLHTHHIVIDVPGFEADDVIATLSRTMDMVIYSTDRDFCALHRDGVTTPIANLKGIQAHEVRLYKTLCGDTTDSISGIVNFGAGAFAKLTAENKINWMRWFDDPDFQIDPTFLGLTKQSHLNWFLGHRELLRSFWKVIGFFEVDVNLISRHMKSGVPDYQKGDLLLKEFLQ